MFARFLARHRSEREIAQQRESYAFGVRRTTFQLGALRRWSVNVKYGALYSILRSTLSWWHTSWKCAGVNEVININCLHRWHYTIDANVTEETVAFGG